MKNMSGGFASNVDEGLSLLWKVLIFVLFIFLFVELIGVFVPGFTFDKIKNVTLGAQEKILQQDNINANVNNNSETLSELGTMTNINNEKRGLLQILGLDKIFTLFSSDGEMKRKMAPTLEDVGIDRAEYYYGYETGNDFKLQEENTVKNNIQRTLNPDTKDYYNSYETNDRYYNTGPNYNGYSNNQELKVETIDFKLQ